MPRWWIKKRRKVLFAKYHLKGWWGAGIKTEGNNLQNSFLDLIILFFFFLLWCIVLSLRFHWTNEIRFCLAHLHLWMCPRGTTLLMLLYHFRLMKLQTSQLFFPIPAIHSSLPPSPHTKSTSLSSLNLLNNHIFSPARSFLTVPFMTPFRFQINLETHKLLQDNLRILWLQNWSFPWCQGIRIT